MAKEHTPDEMGNFNRTRILSDAEALKSGAGVNEKGQIEFTKEQVEKAEKEMRYDKDPAYEKMVVFRASIRDITKEILHGECYFNATNSPIGEEGFKRREEYFTRLKNTLLRVEKPWAEERSLEWFRDLIFRSIRTFNELLDLDLKILNEILKNERGTKYKIKHLKKGEIGEEEKIVREKTRLWEKLNGEWSGFWEGVNAAASFLD